MRHFIFSIVLLIFVNVNAQKTPDQILKAQEQMGIHHDLYIKFPVQNKADVKSLPSFFSIDKIENKEQTLVYTYIHASKFPDLLALNIPFEVLVKSMNPDALTMATSVSQMVNWDRYPTYEVYMELLQNFATNYPEICRLENIGTSQNGRNVSVLKISDNPDETENEPTVFFTGQMHGDEMVSYILLLRLVDYLLANYPSDVQVQNLIDHVEIWINPLANPDGLYQGGNHTVAGATRYLANGIDPNRNFPSPYSQHPDGHAWAQEVIDMMAFADTHRINLSTNLHSGAEVVNYPWDTWDSATRLHVDDNWWQLVSYEYADTVFANSFGDYFTDVSSDGVTNGGDWYVIDGGRQDYMTFFKQGREFTLELSSIKFLDAEDLPDYWDFNYKSFLNYMEQSLYGIRGIISDAESGNPLVAKVEITGHDDDNSFVYSGAEVGNYHRFIYEGTYDVTYSCTGYQPQTFTLEVHNYETTIQDVSLVPLGVGIDDYAITELFSMAPNPMVDQELRLVWKTSAQDINLHITDAQGRSIYQCAIDSTSEGQLYKLVLDKMYACGIYTVCVSTANEQTYRKLIKL